MKNFLISLKRVFKRVLNNDFQRLVSSLSFQTALSIVLVIGLYVWIIHNIGILDNLLPMIRATLLEYLAPTAAETLERQLNNAINKTSENITGIISLILILIIGFRTFEDLRQGLKAITNEDMNNSLWQRILTFIFVITLSPLLVLIIAFATWLASFFDFILIINFTSLIPWTIFITLFYGWGLFNKLIWYKYTLVALIVSICILFADQLLLVLA
ncbi:MAG: YihY/virulence factor BrkB family protein, partial [Bdellovibrionales bacterium]|nr:YihY/virulence factor BrkB family protein [Bdellovibrionales bacterium]